MVELIDRKDFDAVISSLKEKERENRFLLMYIETLKFEVHYVIYSSPDCYILYIFNLIIATSNTKTLSKETIEFIKKLDFRMIIASGIDKTDLSTIEHKSLEEEHLMALDRKNAQIRGCQKPLISLPDYIRLLNFYNSTKEYKDYYTKRDIERKHAKADNENFAFAIFKDKEIVSALMLNDALIASVITKEEFRGEGYARENILNAISYFFENNPKEEWVYLFYSKVELKDYYAKIGFKDICKFQILKR